jgi:phosphopantothenoylcysteine decarboxylase/phosphopantothenate--cysteine ligase
MLSGRRIILGVTGGIAAYKACEIVRGLKKRGAEVIVIMTASAQKFVTPLTFETLSENEVIAEMFPAQKVVKTRHISLAQWPDLFLIAPATANLIGKIASGICDDILTTVLSSTKAPILLSPSMNVNMYENPILQENIKKLKGYGYIFIEPEVGDLACGTIGKGRLPAVEIILKEVEKILAKKKDLEGKSILITAGRTEEPIDPVRFLSNRSSGKMGYALAEEAKERGANVTLISGPASLPPPVNINFVQVKTGQEMFEAVKKHFAKTDCLIMTAAVSDFSPALYQTAKIKKEEKELVLKLKPSVDILKEMGKRKGKKVLVGFSLETENEIPNAKNKLKEKNLDLIAVNNPKEPNAGFEVDTNIVTLIDKKGKVEKLPLLPKREVAEKILDKVTTLLKKR